MSTDTHELPVLNWGNLLHCHGERACEFSPDARVFSEMDVRVIVSKVLEDHGIEVRTEN